MSSLWLLEQSMRAEIDYRVRSSAVRGRYPRAPRSWHEPRRSGRVRPLLAVLLPGRGSGRAGGPAAIAVPEPAVGVGPEGAAGVVPEPVLVTNASAVSTGAASTGAVSTGAVLPSGRGPASGVLPPGSGPAPVSERAGTVAGARS